MDISEVLKIADELLLSLEDGIRLDELQKAILKGTLEGYTYDEIAAKNKEDGSHSYSHGYVRDTASKLWQDLSKAIGKEVKKSNVGSILEKVIVSHSVSSGNFISFHKINICANEMQSSTSPSSNKTKIKPCIDLDRAPEITTFYGRNEELNTLKNWIIDEQCRLITLVGLSGIGKTSLAIKLISEVQSQFDYIVYRSLCFPTALETLFTELQLNTSIPLLVSDRTEQRINQFLEMLRQKRCLIIIDDLQTLFQPGKLAGQYQDKFIYYRDLFKQISKLSHQSCLLLISRQIPANITFYQQKSIRLFKLEGLKTTAKEIFKEYDLLEEENWEILTERFVGHPVWLEITAKMIKELFGGKVSDFLSYSSLLLSDEIIFLLNRLFEKLIVAEQTVINYLVQQENPVNVHQILQEIPFDKTETLNAIQSLKRRCILSDIINNNEYSLLKLNNLFQTYIRTINQS